MKVLLVHPSPLMYSEIFLRLEPIGVERVAAAVRAAGHEVRLLDLQIFGHADYYRELADFAPHAVGFSLNYLANVPEVLDLAKETKRRRPGCFVFAGGHSGSFIAEELLEHAEGALDAMVRGEGEAITPRLLEAAGDPRLATLPGVVTPDGAGPAPTMLDDIDRFQPARDLTRRRHKYFIGVLDPCASAELTRGENSTALEVARELGFTVAVNIIADPDWDERRFAIVREWALTVPEIVHLTVATPYPGTEIWHTESRRLTSLDYRLFDVQHAVLPTRLPLKRFYEELVATQAVINRKHLGFTALREVAGLSARLALRGQTNFLKMLWKFGSVYNRDRQYSDHLRPVTYQMRPPAAVAAKPGARDLFVHQLKMGGPEMAPHAPPRSSRPE